MFRKKSNSGLILMGLIILVFCVVTPAYGATQTSVSSFISGWSKYVGQDDPTNPPEESKTQTQTKEITPKVSNKEFINAWTNYVTPIVKDVIVEIPKKVTPPVVIKTPITTPKTTTTKISNAELTSALRTLLAGGLPEDIKAELKGRDGRDGANGASAPSVVTVIPANPAQNFSGATIFSATDLSSQHFETNTATTATLTVSGSSNLNGGVSTTDITATGDISQTGTGTFSTGTGAITLNGNTSISGTNTLSVGGQATFSHIPSLAHNFSAWPTGTSNVSDSTLYINPASSIADGNLLGLAVAGDVKFLVDAEGDIYGNNLILTGSTTSGSTTVASLTVEGSSILGDAPADSITINGTIASNLIFTDNTYDIGASGATRPRTGYFGTSVVAPSFVGDLTGNAATVTTNANLTGPITSVGNATSVAAQTGTGSTFVMNTSPTLVTPVLGVATGTSFTIGANTLDTNEWAFLDGLNQTLATTSSPTFAGITNSALTSGRVTFAGASGVLTDDADLTFATDTLSATKLLSSTSVSTPSLISTGAIGITPASGNNVNLTIASGGLLNVSGNTTLANTDNYRSVALSQVTGDVGPLLISSSLTDHTSTGVKRVAIIDASADFSSAPASAITTRGLQMYITIPEANTLSSTNVGLLGLDVNVASLKTTGDTGNIAGGAFATRSYTTGTTASITGLSANAQVLGAGTVTNLTAGSYTALSNAAATITNAKALSSSLLNINAGSTITDAYILIANNLTNAGTITNTYGVYVGDITAGTQTNTPYSFYASDSGAYNYFAGNVGIGTTNPVTILDINGVTTFRGNIIAGTDNTYDIGASGATRPRTGYFGTSLVAPTINATTAFQLNGTSINTAGTLSNVAYLDQGNTFTAKQTVNASIPANNVVGFYNTSVTGYGPYFSAGDSTHYSLYVADRSATLQFYIQNQTAFVNTLSAPTILGGTATTQDLTFQTTSGVGATGADMHFLVGNNGATEAMTILNSGNVGIGYTNPSANLAVNGSVAIGTTSAPSSAKLTVSGGYLDVWDSVNTLIRLDHDGANAYLQSYTSGSAGILALNPSGGNVGIGTTNPGAKLHLDSTGNSTAFVNTSSVNTYPNTLLTTALTSATNDQQIGLYNQVLANYSSSFSGKVSKGIVSEVSSVSGNGNNPGDLYGIDVLVYQRDSVNSGALIGSNIRVENTSSGNPGFMYGNLAIVSNSGSGGATSMFGSYNQVSNSGSGTVSNLAGIYAGINNTGTATNTYGVYISDVTSGTQTNQAYGLYQVDTGARNYFAGNVGIGTTDPGAALEVAGTSLFSGGLGISGTTVGSASTILSANKIITSVAGAAPTESRSQSVWGEISMSPSSGSLPDVTGFGEFTAYVPSSYTTAASINKIRTISTYAINDSTASTDGDVTSFYGTAYGRGEGTLNRLAGAELTASLESSQNATNLTFLRGVVTHAGTGTVTNVKGLDVGGIVSYGGGTITDTYGVYVGDITSGTQTNTPYSFYASDSGAYNYFAGNVGIGTTSPLSLFDVVKDGGDGWTRVVGYGGKTQTDYASLNGTVASPTKKLSGDILYRKRVLASWDTSGSLSASFMENITAAEDFSATNLGSSYAISIAPIGSATRVERFTIDGSGDILLAGNVGIGTTDPGAPLDVLGATIIHRSSGNQELRLQSAGTGNYAQLTYHQGSTQTWNQYVNVGASPTLIWANGVGTVQMTLAYSGGLSVTNLASCGGVQTNGSGLMSCTSDERLKDIQQTFTAGLDAINQINPQTYSWKSDSPMYDGGVLYSGFIAQNIQSAIPEAANVGSEGYLQINTTTILAASINAIKELNLTLGDLSDRVTALENSNGGGLIGDISALGQYAADFFIYGVDKVENGVVYMKNLVIENLKIGSPTKRTGITFYDEITGDPYCLSISNGAQKIASGECVVIIAGSAIGSGGGSGGGSSDSIPPDITLTGDATINLAIDETYTEQGAEAIDAVDGSVAVIISGSVDTSTDSTNTITYSATDNSGNQASIERTVIVGSGGEVVPGPEPEPTPEETPVEESSPQADSTPPAILLNGDAEMTLTIGDIYTEQGAIVTDNVTQDMTPIIAGEVDTLNSGIYILTYNATDEAGNPAVEVTRTVTVVAPPAPEEEV